MIRSDLLKSVHDALASHSFLALEDFRVKEVINSQKDPCVLIEYRYDKSFFFRFVVPKSKTEGEYGERHYIYSGLVNPGQESAEENFKALEREGLIVEIVAWLKRLHEDIVSAPVARQFAAQASAIGKMRERLEQLPDEPLSRDEILQFQAALDQLKTEVAEQLKRETADKDTLKRRIDELGRDIDFLKTTLGSMTKLTWMEALAVRVQRWRERFSFRQLSGGARAIKQLMPATVAEQLDTVADVADQIADVVEGKPDAGNGSAG